MERTLRIAAIGLRGLPAAYSGLESAAEGLYAELARRGHDITVYCRPEYVATTGGRYRDMRLRAAPAVRTRALETLSHVAASLAHAVRSRAYDVVHLHALAPALFSSITRMCGVPTVCTVQGLDWRRAKWRGFGARLLRRAERAMTQNVDRVIVVSRDLQHYFSTVYGRDTVFIPNGIEGPANTAADPEVLSAFGLDADGYVLLVARLVPEKRVEDLIRAFRAIETPVRLAITGSASYTGDYVERLHRLAAGDPRICFTGFQHGPALEALFRGARLFVLPSELEGMPMAVLESIVHEIPLVVSDIPPHRELLAGVPEYDMFFPVGDVRALAARLRQSFAEEPRHRALAARARAAIERTHAWPAIAAATEGVLCEAAERGAA